MLGLTGMGGGVASLMWAGAGEVGNTIWLAGRNVYGAFGLNNDTPGYSSPTQISDVTDWLAFQNKNFNHCLGIRGVNGSAEDTNGTLWGMGQQGSWGELGLNDRTSRSSPTQVGTDSTWAKLSVGSNVVATKSNGTLWVWGHNANGSIGDNSNVPRSSPMQVGTDTNWDADKIQISNGTAMAIKTDGTLWIWGNNGNGGLGQNNQTQYSSPTQVGTDTTWAMGLSGAGLGWGVKTDGTLWSWGQNYFGLLGQNEGGGSDYGYAPGPSSPTQIGTDTNWQATNKSISLGTWAAGAVKTDGTLWMWGRGFTGMLGLNQGGDDVSGVTRSSPTQVGTNTTWSKVMVGIDVTYGFKTDGTLWSWGRNNYGQLGLDGPRGDNRSSPSQIGSAPSAWADVTGSYVSTVGVREDGTMWFWGYDGTGPIPGWISSPTQIPGSDWSSGYYDVRGVNVTKTDGTMWSWGENQAGNSGTNNNTAYASPHQVPGTRWPKDQRIGGTWNTHWAITTE